MSEQKPGIIGWMLQGATFMTVAGGLWWLSEKNTLDKLLQFSDPEIKSQTEYHVRNTDPVAVVRQSYRDSVAQAKFRRTQDSMDLERDKLTKANAYDVYQVRKELDTLKMLLQHTLEHVEN